MRAVKGFHILTLLANSYTTKTNQKITIHGSSISTYSLLPSHFTEALFHKLRGPINSRVLSPVYSSLITSGFERGAL